MQPQEIQDRRFSTAFRGYDPTEVRQFLAHVAGLYSDLRGQLASVGDGVRLVDGPAGSPDADANSSTDGVVGDGLDDRSAVGTEARGLSLAAVEELREQAQREAVDVLAAARAEAQTIVSRANDEAARVVLRARAESRGKPSAERSAAIEAALAEVPLDHKQARDQARLMISEARAVRERILGDLAKRRRTAHVQLEQLRVAREKLLETLRDARRVVEDASRDLSTAEVEARLAAETAGRRVANEPVPTVEELEAELFGGRFLTTASASGRSLLAEHDAPTMIGRDEGGDAIVDDVVGGVGVGVDVVVPVDVVVVDVDGAGEVLTVVGVVAGDDGVDVADVVVVVVDVDGADVDVVVVAADVVVVDVDGADVDVVAADVADVAVVLDAELVEADAAVGHQDVHGADGSRGADAATDTGGKLEVGNAVDVETSVAVDQALHGAKPATVDDLFARLRAERTEAAEQARVLLASTPPAPKRPRSPKIAKTGDASSVESSVLVIDVTAAGRADVSIGETAVGTGAGSGVDARMMDHEGPGPTDGFTDSEDHDATLAEFGSAAATGDLGHNPAEVADLVAQRLARSVKRHLRDEQGSVLVALRTARGLPLLSALLGSAEEQRARLNDVVAQSLADAGSSLQVTQFESVVTEIAGAIRGQLDLALEAVVTGSAESADLGEGIAAAYRVWTIERLDALIRHPLKVAA